MKIIKNVIFVTAAASGGPLNLSIAAAAGHPSACAFRPHCSNRPRHRAPRPRTDVRAASAHQSPGGQSRARAAFPHRHH